MYEKENEIIQKISQGMEGPLIDIYSLYRDEFILWSTKHYTINEEQSKDLFQDAIIDFQRNIQTGKLKVLTSSIKTYLFQIAKFKVINFIKRESRQTYIDDIELIKGERNAYILEEEKQYKLDDIAKAISKLPDDCQTLLKLYYYKEYDMSSIARELNYKNSDTAKAKKSVCMKKLIVELSKISKIFIL